jgi:hypothetical protein
MWTETDNRDMQSMEMYYTARIEALENALQIANETINLLLTEETEKPFKSL